MGDNLESWKQEGRYLPEFMRDFHDQKELFKFLDEVRARADAKEGSHRSLEAVTWSAAHIYTVDIFLWVMASHGYTLQRARKPFNFANIVDTVSAATARYREQSMKAMRSIFPAIVVALLAASQAQAEPSLVAANDHLLLGGSEMVLPGYTIPAGTILCHSADAAVRSDHAGCWIARGGQRVEIIAALPSMSQLRLWSTDGSEGLTVWSARDVADDIQKGSK